MSILLYEQERARKAWEMVVDIAKEKLRGNQESAKKIEQCFRSQVRKAPAMIQKNGLGQSLAFLAAKGFSGGNAIVNLDQAREYASSKLYQYLGQWMLKAINQVPNYLPLREIKPGAGPQKDPLDFLMQQCTIEQLVWATAEVQRYLVWARRFAESQLSEPENEGNQE